MEVDDTLADQLAPWRETWFGDPGDWPEPLSAAAWHCLALTVPATVAWGPDYHLLYNQAYADLLGDLHPGVRGRPAWDAAAAMWPVVGPMLHRVRTTGETQHGERVALPLDTPDGRRTHWYSWTYSPVWCHDRVEGVFAVVYDVTDDELSRQHERAVSAARQVSAVTDVVAALRELVGVLGDMPDVRFAVCHRFGDDTWDLLAQAGNELRRATAASVLEHAALTGRWPAAVELARGASGRATEVRAPSDRRGIWASWTAVADVSGRIAALTVGFDPAVGDPGTHRPLLETLVRNIRGPGGRSTPATADHGSRRM